MKGMLWQNKLELTFTLLSSMKLLMEIPGRKFPDQSQTTVTQNYVEHEQQAFSKAD